jgi:hypothetical protein
MDSALKEGDEFLDSILTGDIVMDEKGDLFADPHSILPRWRDHISQLLNVHGVNNVRKKHKHQDDYCPAELSKAVARKIR